MTLIIPKTRSNYSPDRITVFRLARSASSNFIDVTTAAKSLNLDPHTTALKLASLTRKGWLVRAKRGLYNIIPLEAEPGMPTVSDDAWIVANEVFSPCYIGGWSAAEYWGLTEQLFNTTLVVTAANIRKRSLKMLGHNFRLFKVPSSRLVNTASIWRGTEKVVVSSRERTIIDCLRNPEIAGGIRHIAGMLREYSLNPEKDYATLIDTARKVGNGATWKRLGYLTEALQINEMNLIEIAESNLSAGISRLDPAVKDKGTLNNRWHLWVNVNIEPDN